MESDFGKRENLRTNSTRPPPGKNENEGGPGKEAAFQRNQFSLKIVVSLAEEIKRFPFAIIALFAQELLEWFQIKRLGRAGGTLQEGPISLR